MVLHTGPPNNSKNLWYLKCDGWLHVGWLHVLQSQVFDVVVVDEAAQALEAATWAGLLKASRAVLAGGAGCLQVLAGGAGWGRCLQVE